MKKNLEDTQLTKSKLSLMHQVLMKFRSYNYYKWVYIAGALLVFLNCLFIESVNLFKFCLAALYGILFYKNVEILKKYKKLNIITPNKEEKKKFALKYNSFRLKVFLFLLAFIILCFIAKLTIKIDHTYFYSCTFVFLFLDRFFVNAGCLLRKFSDLKQEIVICCCGCPCRGWDLIMIHTPLLFAMNCEHIIENFFIGISSILAAISFVCWEKCKYSLVQIRKKCAKPCNLSLCKENLTKSL